MRRVRDTFVVDIEVGCGHELSITSCDLVVAGSDLAKPHPTTTAAAIPLRHTRSQINT
jgi:hypothetical protein